MRQFIFIFFSVIIATIGSFHWIPIPNSITQIIYGVEGVLFSVGMAIATTFNFRGIKNKKILNNIKQDIFYIRNQFIYYFVISTLLFIICSFYQYINIHKYRFNVILLCLIYILISIGYIIFNFIKLQKFSCDLSEKLDSI